MPFNKVIIAGGGTGGHIYPAIAIANGLKHNRNNDIEILFIGTRKGLEKDLIPKAGFSLEIIRVKGFERKLSFDTLKSIGELFLGAFDSLKIIFKEKPDFVLGTGGYVAGPIVFFASLMGIPTMIHEQNVKPGITNRILSRVVDKIAISFPSSKKYFPKEKVVVTGNPVRKELTKVNRKEVMEKLGFSPNLPTITSFGGSQGAVKLNDAILDIIEEISDSKEFQLLHITGKKHYKTFIHLMENKGITQEKLGHIKIKPYIHEMQEAYGVADLIISRAGAITISEISFCGKPAILIPLPTAADNHQDFNARYMEENGAAVFLHDNDLTGETLLGNIRDIIYNPPKLKNMAKASKKLQNPEALNRILDEILKLTQG